MIKIILLIFLATTPFSNGVVLLRNVKYNTQCLSVQGSSRANTAGYQLVDCDADSPLQWMDGENWEGYSSTPGQLRHLFSNKCPSVDAWGAGDGIFISQYDCLNQANQHWGIINGNYLNSFQLNNSFSGKCLTAEGGGSYTDQWACYDMVTALHQYWKIDFIKPTPKKTILQNYKYANKCLRVQGASSDNNAELELADCDITNSEQWLDVSAWDDLYSVVRFSLSQKCLTVSGAGTDNGIRINQYDCASPTPNNQIWGIHVEYGGEEEGIFQLVSTVSGRCLTAEGSGSYMDQWECFSPTDAAHQYWKPVAVTLSGESGEQQDAPALTLNPPFPVYAALENGGSTSGICIYSASLKDSALSLKSCDSALADKRTFEVSHLVQRKDLSNREYLQSYATGFCLSHKIVLSKNLQGGFAATLTPMLKKCGRLIWQLIPSYQDPTYFHIQLAGTNQNLKERVCLMPDISGTKLTTMYCDASISHYWKLHYANPDNICGPLKEKMCSGEYEGMCCSSQGKCGLGSDFCGSGCQDGYGGSCAKLSDLMTKVSNVPNSDRPGHWDRLCGPAYKKRCTGAFKSKCCGIKSSCGNDQHSCLEKYGNAGCQRVYGACQTLSDQYKNIWLRFG